ncbi:Retron-type RNA-directed DNA polymerase [Fimbriiglobus ruber]|uniref:Retron-type RNA-directed DNA polymerase n=1 Tax=Fimbriiglobus ruber TaxID=1908690 RepID=A0A225DQ99_9BACT|nr:Retron-type RNA-directed DNA polymerase [Fimbriiglobus ruber]
MTTAPRGAVRNIVGGVLSPLLANLLLDDWDQELERRGHTFCRYADDCNSYVESEVRGNAWWLR